MAEGGLNAQTANRLINLMKTSGYPLKQVNGQRVFGPHPDYREFVPPKGSEIFVGKLPRDIYEDGLVPVFTKAGTIHELRLMLDFNGFNRGYAFVTYMDTFSADRAIRLLDNYEIRPGRNIGVCKSVDNCRLFVGGIPRELTRADIFTEFTKYTRGLKEVIMYSEPGNQAKNRGFAFVEYDSHRAAAMARRELVPAKTNLWNSDLKIDWAEPESVVDPLVMQRYLKGNIDTEIKKYLKSAKDLVTVLYARNLPPELNEVGLTNLFSLSGHLSVTKVKKMRDFAFVHFDTKFEAQLALTQTNGVVIDGCAIEVTWAKPPECSLRRHQRCNVDGYKSYPRQQSGSSSMYDLQDGSSASFNGDNSTLMSTPAAANSAQISTAQSQAQKYSKWFADFCQKKGWGEPVYDLVLLPATPHMPMQYRCKLTFPGAKISGAPLVAIGAAVTSGEAKNKAAYNLMTKLGWIEIADGKPSSSALDTLSSSGVHNGLVNGHNLVNVPNNLVNGLSSLTLNDVDKGQGDHGLFLPSSDDIFKPYDGPSLLLDAMSTSSNGAIPKTSSVKSDAAHPPANRCSVWDDFTQSENNAPHVNGITSLFQNDSSDPFHFLRNIFSKPSNSDF